MNRNTDNDLGYFDIYGPAPLFEAMANLSPSPIINSTTTHYGPFLYGLAKLINAKNCLEIGLATGWSSGFLAWACKENNGFYRGVDICGKGDLKDQMTKLELPHEIICDTQGSVNWLENQDAFGPESLDLVFDDGWHNTEYVQQEVELVYPLLKKNGILVMHDVYAACETVYPIIKEKYPWQTLRILPCYGMGILVKQEGKTEVSTIRDTVPTKMMDAMYEFSQPTEYMEYGPFLYLFARAISAIGVLRCTYLGRNLSEMWFLTAALQETNARYGDYGWINALGETLGEQITLACLDNIDRAEEIYSLLQDQGYGYMMVKNITMHEHNIFVSNHTVEHLRIANHSIFRKMDNYVEKTYWPDGDEKENVYMPWIN